MKVSYVSASALLYTETVTKLISIDISLEAGTVNPAAEKLKALQGPNGALQSLHVSLENHCILFRESLAWRIKGVLRTF